MQDIQLQSHPIVEDRGQAHCTRVDDSACAAWHTSSACAVVPVGAARGVATSSLVVDLALSPLAADFLGGIAFHWSSREDAQVIWCVVDGEMEQRQPVTRWPTGMPPLTRPR
jgi:hypothetical protein